MSNPSASGSYVEMGGAPPPASQRSRLVAGLDVGRQVDPSALCVVEQSRRPMRDRPERQVTYYDVRHLERLPLGTDFAEMAGMLVQRFSAPPLSGIPLAVDNTGIGAPFIAMLREHRINATIHPILITAGQNVSIAIDGLHVAKVVLITQLQVLFVSGRIAIAKSLPEAKTLVKELETYEGKITQAGNEVFSAREGKHDDLLLGTALAVYLAEQIPPWQPASSIPNPPRPRFGSREYFASRPSPFERFYPSNRRRNNAI